MRVVWATKIYCLMVLESVSPSLGCQELWLLLRAVREGSVPAQPPTLVDGCLHVLTMFFLHVRLYQNVPFYKDGSHIELGIHTTPASSYFQ